MWWTQPKLALIALATNATGFAVIVTIAPRPAARIAAALLMQVALLIAYAGVARRLAEAHLAGRTERVFERRLWGREWKPALDRTFLPAGAMPRADGASFYRQVLGDTDEARASLYRALAAWEGARLLWIGSTLGVTLAIASSTLTLAIAERLGLSLWQPALASLTIPTLVLVLPEALNIWLLRRAFLRSGVLSRVAVLTPRDATDLGLRSTEPADEFGRDGAVALFVALGVPVLLLVAFVFGVRGLLTAAVVMVVAAVTLPRLWRAHLDFLVNTIPFLRFPGPAAVSVLLDLMHRKRAQLSFFAILWSVASISPFRVSRAQPPDIFSLEAALCLGYLIAITFNDQYAGYWGYAGATNFEACFRRSLAKVEEAATT
jgi:hypothetical protein